MKTKTLTFVLTILMTSYLFAQDRTTVTANSNEISDNLDLRAVASIFGESENLEDFERRLNNPRTHISNLDLNNDNQVDYLRVIETVEGRAHLIVIQSVLGRDVYQDIATVEVEKDRFNQIQVQVVGDVYMYGHNYIYQPVYAYTPVIYTNFWTPRYRPYCSMWYWDFYPSFYIAWNPFPIYTYQNYINVCINTYNIYNYVNVRHCTIAYNNYRSRRANGYELRYPERAFEKRNYGIVNRYELENERNLNTTPRNNFVNNNIRNHTVSNPKNNESVNNTRNYTYLNNQSQNNTTASFDPPRNVRNTIRNQVSNQPERELNTSYEAPRNVRNTIRNQVNNQPERELNTSYEAPRNIRNTIRNQVNNQPQRELNTSYETPRNVRNNSTNITPSQPTRSSENNTRAFAPQRANINSNSNNSSRVDSFMRANRRS